MGVPHVGPPVFNGAVDVVHAAQCQEAYETRTGHPFDQVRNAVRSPP